MEELVRLNWLDYYLLVEGLHGCRVQVVSEVLIRIFHFLLGLLEEVLLRATLAVVHV